MDNGRPLDQHDHGASFPEYPEQLTLFPPPPEKKGRTYLIHLILFLLTVFTTLAAGARLEGGSPFRRPADLFTGIPFSFTLMIILLTHEMGHYLTSQQYGVKASLPYFIPAPPFPFMIGTFGAFIRMRSPILRKRALLDIGASGPIAGFCVSIVAVIVGLKLSRVVDEGSLPEFTTIKLGNPLIFSFLADLLVRVPDEGYDIMLHPVAFAGWIGLFVTSLNLLPIGQLDGGHVVYAFLGKRQKAISIGVIGLLVILGLFGWPGWYVWAFLTAILGVRHPPVIDSDLSLSKRDKILGWATLAVFILCFMPVPFHIR